MERVRGGEGGRRNGACKEFVDKVDKQWMSTDREVLVCTKK